LTPEQVNNKFSIVENGTCLIRTDNYHLVLCIFVDGVIRQYSIEPFLYNIGLNNIIASIADVRYFILPRDKVVTIKELNDVYKISPDSCYEVTTEFDINYERLHFLIRKCGIIEETDNHIVKLYHSVNKPNTSTLETALIKRKIENVEHRIEPENDLPQPACKAAKIFENIMVEIGGKEQSVTIDDDTTIRDILATLIGEANIQNYGIYRLQTNAQFANNIKVVNINEKRVILREKS